MTDFRTGFGGAWLDLLATLRGRYHEVREDLLADPAALQAFLAEHELAPRTRPREIDVTRARELREALHRLTVATYRGQPSAAADVALVDAALADGMPLRVRRTTGTIRAARPQTTRQALTRIATEAVADLVGPRRELLRPCGDPSCSGFFLDYTGRRRWCSDERCGVRARVRAHRERARHLS